MRVDFHTHILPEIDDGSRSVEQSLEMLAAQKARGIEIVVATPHFYPQEDRPEKFLRRREKAFEKVTGAAKGKGLPEIIKGAEVYYFSGISSWDGLRDFAIEGTDYLLLEMPAGKWTERMLEEVRAIHSRQGLVPIIAHLDRYINIFTAGRTVKKLEEMAVVIQANSSFFTDKKTARLAMKMLKDGCIDIIASDCHNTGTRPPDLDKVRGLLAEKRGAEYINRIEKTEERLLPKFLNIL